MYNVVDYLEESLKKYKDKIAIIVPFIVLIININATK